MASSAARTASKVIGAPIETTSAPPALQQSAARKGCGFFVSGHDGLPQPIIAAARLTARRMRHVRAAAALQPGQRVADLGVGRLLLVAQERGRGHDPAVDAVAALRHLFLDVSGLQRMRLVRRAEAGERDDLAVADRRDRRDAGADRLAVEMHGAGAALGEPAAEMRIVQAEIVAQRVEQRHVLVRLHGVHLAVDVEGKLLGHRPASSICAAAFLSGPAMCRLNPHAAASAGAKTILKTAVWEHGPRAWNFCDEN